MTECKAEFHGAALVLRESGEFDAADGKHVKYGKSIKIQVGANSIKISAIQLAGLVQAIQRKDIKSELTARFNEEKKAFESLGGF